MKNKLFILFLMTFLAGCGFKPIHKINNDAVNVGTYSIEIINGVSREIVNEINRNINSEKDEPYKASLVVNENMTPIVINTNGTVSKYRIEIIINYQLVRTDTNEQISKGTTRGFAQYDVGTSEINNEDTRVSMVKIATKNALQIMISKIQSKISQLNDN